MSYAHPLTSLFALLATALWVDTAAHSIPLRETARTSSISRSNLTDRTASPTALHDTSLCETARTSSSNTPPPPPQTRSRKKSPPRGPIITTEELIRIVLQKHPSHQAQLHTCEVAREALAQKKSGRLPRITASFEAQGDRRTFLTAESAGNFSSMLTLSAHHVLYDQQHSLRAIERAGEEIIRQEIRHEESAHALAHTVREMLFTHALLRWKEALSILEQRNARNTVEALQVRVDLGSATYQELAQARLVAREKTKAVTHIHAEAAALRTTLTQVSGRSFSAETVPLPPLASARQLKALSFYQTVGKEANPTLRTLTHELKSGQREAEILSSYASPRVTVDGGVYALLTTESLIPPCSGQGRLSVTLPLFDGGERRHAHNQAKATNARTAALIEQENLVRLSRIEKQYRETKKARDAMLSARETLAQARRQKECDTILFERGLISAQREEISRLGYYGNAITLLCRTIEYELAAEALHTAADLGTAVC